MDGPDKLANGGRDTQGNARYWELKCTRAQYGVKCKGAGRRDIAAQTLTTLNAETA